MSKYPQGYIPKIEYWQYKLNNAIETKDWSQAEYCMKKLNHFMSRQYVTENQVPNNVIAGVDFGESLEALTHLGRS